MFKECSFVLLMFLVILALSSAVYSRTTDPAYAQIVSLPSSSQEVTPFKKWYDEQKEMMQRPSNAVSVKITSPTTGQKVPVGELKVSGTSTDNSTTNCQVYVDVNDIKPMQNTIAVGPTGQNDYSNWTFTYTNKYHLISEEVNELTSKLSCINNPANITKYYSVNVTGVAPSLAAANNTNATTKNVTTNNNNNNNQVKASVDTINQTRKQTPQVQQEPKYELQSELAPPANSTSQSLKETQKQEVEESQKESITDGQIAELSTSEVVPLGKSSDLNSLTKEPEDTTVEDEEKLTELTEPAGELLDYSYDQEQTDEDELKPTETPSQPQDFQEQQPLEADQPIVESPVQSFGHKIQPSQLGMQPLEEQPILSNQQIPESRLSAQEQHMQEQSGKNIEEDKQAYEKDESVPFVLPFDSQDVTPGS